MQQPIKFPASHRWDIPSHTYVFLKVSRYGFKGEFDWMLMTSPPLYANLPVDMNPHRILDVCVCVAINLVDQTLFRLSCLCVGMDWWNIYYSCILTTKRLELRYISDYLWQCVPEVHISHHCISLNLLYTGGVRHCGWKKTQAMKISKHDFIQKKYIYIYIRKLLNY